MSEIMNVSDAFSHNPTPIELKELAETISLFPDNDGLICTITITDPVTNKTMNGTVDVYGIESMRYYHGVDMGSMLISNIVETFRRDLANKTDGESEAV